MDERVVVVVPIYKPALSVLEAFSLDVSLAALAGRTPVFIAPRGLDCGYYTDRYAHRYAGARIAFFDPVFFASIPGYNRLLLSPAFYASFAQHEFMLILQTDAIVLHDALDDWCARPFDYVGAPWPDGVQVHVNLGRFEGERGRHVKSFVGNGGLSLRRIAKQSALLREFPEAADYFSRSGSSEDLFFSLMGALSVDYVLPNEVTASCFALELQPAYYFAVNDGRMPMGGHAWWKYDPAFWQRQLAVAAPQWTLPQELALPALPAGR